jgi:hypothetical protein
MDYNSAKSIGESFLQSFFSQNVSGQASFYGNDSLLSFESEIFSGSQEIIGKLSSLPIKQSEVKNYEIQPSGTGILIYLSGLIIIEGESNPMNFVRVFFLANAGNSYYLKNDIYKVTFA